MKENSGDRKKIIITGLVALCALFVLTGVLLLVFSGAFRGSTVVEVFPENTYDETLRVVTDIDYEPFSYVDDDGEYTGLDVEMIAEIANRLHMNLDLTLLDWNEANERLLTGEADAILNMETDLVVHNDALIATIPTAEKQYVVYGSEKVSSVAELYGRKVASLHSMSELNLGDGITYVDSYAKIFEGLRDSEYEFAICPIQVGNVFVKKLGLTDVRASYAVSHVYGAIALLSENVELKNRMDEVISDMTKEGRIDELDSKWITSRYQTMSIRGMIEDNPWIIIVFISGVVLILFLLYVLNTQTRNIKRTEAHSKELQEKLDIIDRQNEELTVAKEKAEQSSIAKTAFLSNMSHDIRTPMNAIIGYTNLALNEERTLGETREYLEKIKGSSGHLLALINDVLEMSRIESGKMELEPIPIDLKETLLEARDMFATQMSEKNIDFSVDVTQIKNSKVLCDKNRLNRVLLNLLSNAFKFTPGGGTVAVTAWQIESEKEGFGKYELRVKDSGIGMTEEFAERVFDAFERERTSTVSGIQGTGLGMAITKNIVDMMGGSIEVSTKPDRGTEFIIRLEFELQESEKDSAAKGTSTGNSSAKTDSENIDTSANTDDKSEEGAKPSQVKASEATGKPSDNAEKEDVENSEPELDFSKMRVLLVEDMEVNREIATMLLSMMGFEIEHAVNGKEAVDKVAASEPGHFDVVLMDIQMPVMNGYDAARGIRALPDEGVSQVPIIAMTANAFSEDIKNAIDAGMNAHIAKPIDANVVKKTITEVLLEKQAK